MRLSEVAESRCENTAERTIAKRLFLPAANIKSISGPKNEPLDKVSSTAKTIQEEDVSIAIINFCN